MMGLIIMEWKKLIQNKLFDFLVFLLLIIGIAYAFLFPWYSYGQTPSMQQTEKAYQYFKGEYDAVQIAEEIKNLQEEQYIYSIIDMLSSLSLDQAQVYYEVYFSKYGSDMAEYQKKYADNKDTLLFADTSEKERTVLNHLYEHAEKLLSYPSYLKRIQEQAAGMKDTQIKSPDIRKAAQRTAEQYHNLPAAVPEFSSPIGIRMALETRVPDILLVLLGCLTAIYLFSQEKSSHMLPLIVSMPRGRKVLCSAKICTGVCCCLLLGSMILGIQLAAAEFYFGFGDLCRPLQTIPEYINSPCSLTVTQLLVLVSLLKVFCGILSFLVCSLICTCCSKNISYAFLTGMVAVSIGCDYLVSEASVFQMLKYLNLSSFFRGTRLFGDYIHIHVGSWMIPYSLLLPFMMVTISMISIILTVIIWSIPIGKAQHPSLRQYLLYIPNKIIKVLATKRKKVCDLFVLESCKLIYTQKVYTILSLTCIVQFFIYQGFTISMDRTEYSFQQRLQSLSGVFSEEKYQRIAEEYNQLNQIQEQIDAYTNRSGSDSSETLRLSDLDYYQTLLRSKETVDRLMTRSDMLKERANRGDKAYFVPDTGYLLLCGLQKPGMRYQPLMISILLTLLLSGIFAIEYECGTESLLRTLPDGKEKLFHMKLRLSILIFLVVFLLSWVPEIIYIIKSCSIKFLWIPAANIPAFQSFPEFITLGMMIMLVLVGRLLFALTNMGVILLVAGKSRSTIAALFFNSIISAGFGVLVLF